MTTYTQIIFQSFVALVKERLSQGFSVKAAKKITGGDITGENSKMPGFTFGVSATGCITGQKLAKVEGSSCSICYALRGNYTFTNVRLGFTRRLKAVPVSLDILSDEWVEYTAAMVTLVKRAPNLTNGGQEFRWMDTGDIQSVPHLLSIFVVCLMTAAMMHWLPTKEKGMLIRWSRSGIPCPENLMIRLSAPMIDRPFSMPSALVGLAGVGLSHVTSTPDHDRQDVCPAPTQGGACVDCRNCWDRSKPAVTYAAH